jgi:AcrR family transcriptional regulator
MPMSDTISRSPARRADAERSAFANAEAQVSMAEISRRAGVGMATLYRNFPSRQELLEALYTDEVNAVCEAADAIDGETPGAVLTAWLHRFFAFYNSKRHVGSELLRQSAGSQPFFNEGRSRVIAAGRPLLLAAQRNGEARADLTLEQILDMVIAIAKIEGEPDYLAPILQATLDGLRPLPLTSSP